MQIPCVYIPGPAPAVTVANIPVWQYSTYSKQRTPFADQFSKNFNIIFFSTVEIEFNFVELPIIKIFAFYFQSIFLPLCGFLLGKVD